MFDHVELPVSDLSASAAFYRAALAPLGIDEAHPSETAVDAESREAVDAFHRAGPDACGRDHGPPGVRRYALDYYAAYLRDPDGHNVEAVHRSPETRARWTWLRLGT